MDNEEKIDELQHRLAEAYFFIEQTMGVGAVKDLTRNRKSRMKQAVQKQTERLDYATIPDANYLP